MTQRIFIILFSVLVYAFPFKMKAQQVIATSGQYNENQQGSLSWTLGETFIATLNSENHYLTQGFHHGKLLLTIIFEKQPLLPNIKAYPNPLHDFLILQAETGFTESLKYELISMQGETISKTKVTGTITEISFREIKAGIYLLRIFNENELLKVVKVVKR